jgi:hypothetical protein
MVRLWKLCCSLILVMCHYNCVIKLYTVHRTSVLNGVDRELNTVHTNSVLTRYKENLHYFFNIPSHAPIMYT